MINLINDDCLNALKKLDADSIDSLVTDPPAGISFMNKEWDSDKGGRDGWIAWMTEVMHECHRVLKPGAHGLVWAIPRTSHWTATALENAGFEVRDVVTHLFGSGFPKSLNVEKAGAGSEWQGWGTALKPASEHWILVRKPLSEKTVASNVLKHGTGGINIDASRVATSEMLGRHQKSTNEYFACSSYDDKFHDNSKGLGRFPANLVLSHSPYCTDDQCDIECAILELDEQAEQEASRFFYCAKISSSERNAGLDEMPDKMLSRMITGSGIPSASITERSSNGMPNRFTSMQKNTHPTVKPKKLMSYFCKMITPPNGTVLDPFMGSGSTGISAKECGFNFIGIEREPDYFEIASKRIDAV